MKSRPQGAWPGSHPTHYQKDTTMTALLAIITIALAISGASPWATGITAACTIWALILDTRAALINRKETT